MTTDKHRVAAYISDSLNDRLQDYMQRKGIASESQAVASILVSVLGDEETHPAIDRLSRLESRVLALESALGNCVKA